MQRYEVKSGEYIVVSASGTVPVISASELGSDIAITIYDPVTKKAGLGRNLQKSSLHRLFNEFPYYKMRSGMGNVLEVRLIGGTESVKSKSMLDQLIEDLNIIDNGKDIIAILSADIITKPHPDSFYIDARSGGLFTLSQHSQGSSKQAM